MTHVLCLSMKDTFYHPQKSKNSIGQRPSIPMMRKENGHAYVHRRNCSMRTFTVGPSPTESDTTQCLKALCAGRAAVSLHFWVAFPSLRLTSQAFEVPG